MDLYDIHTHDVPTTESDEDHPETGNLNNVSYIINVYPLGFEYAKDNDFCPWFSCGVHPWYSEDAEPQINFLKEIANDPRIVAIGEAGLDRLKGPSLDIQQAAFEEQIKLSEQLQKPLMIHCVKAWEELLHTHKKHQPTQPWIIHGYRGKPELTKQLLKHGFLFSMGEKINRESVKMIPLNKLFCETDTLDLSIEEVYQEVAQTKGITIEKLADQIKENIQRVFPLTCPQEAI